MNTHATPLRALRLPQVIDKTGISRSQLFRMMKAGHFPHSHHLTDTGSISVWDESVIDAWLKSKFAGGAS